ncbi:DUF4382 domain-containing protein [Myxococcaceae bacterium GXIMD 01537]
MNRPFRLVSRLTALAAVMLLPLLGCGSGSEGKLTLKLTDAAGDFKAAVVTIDEIYLQGEGGKVVLSNTQTTTNLITLANDTATLVQDAVVPEGTYGELRFVISGGYVEVENADGSTSIYASSPTYAGLPEGAKVAGDLQMPSLAQSGLKVKLPGDKLTLTGEQKILLVDFDVAQSFGHDAGQGKKWVMHPVIEATDILASGSVKVTLSKESSLALPALNGTQLTLGSFKASLKNAAGSEEQLALVDTDQDGVFEAHFKFLIPGTFTVGIVAPEGVGSIQVTPNQPATHTIDSGKDGAFAFTLTGVTVTGEVN